MAATHAACDPASCPSPCSALPVALLARILQHVPQHQRLTSCALVSRDWTAAAAAGTVSIARQKLDSTQCESVGTWIQQHARQLESIQLETNAWWEVDKPLLQLPGAELQQLTDLQLKGVKVQLPASVASTSISNSSTPSGHMPKLLDLDLQHCTCKDAASLLQLGPFTGVTQLRLQSIRTVDEDTHPAATKPDLPGATAALLLSLGAMTQLQRMQLGSWQERDVLLAALSCSTQALAQDTLQHHQSTHPMLRQCLSPNRLKQLQELRLQDGEFSPAVLANVSHLLVLELHGCTFLSDAAGVKGVDALLAAVGSMQQLRHLAIQENEGCKSTLEAAQPSSFSGLITSSHLTTLSVCATNSAPLPRGAMQHMLPASSRLPQLQKLALSCCLPTEARQNPWFMTATELAALISACPGLTSLDIIGALRPGDSCCALLQLPLTCRVLSVGGNAFGDSAAAIVVQLTQLTYLDWSGSQSLTDAGLYQLTALQGLRMMYLHANDGLSEGVVRKEEGYMCEAIWLVTADQPKPVWKQLQDRFCACPKLGLLAPSLAGAY